MDSNILIGFSNFPFRYKEFYYNWFFKLKVKFLRSMSQPKTAEDIMNVRRAYTTGGRVGARQMFVFNEDGTIAGLKKVEQQVVSPNQGSRANSGKFSKDKKFGHLSSKMSVSAMSVGAESKVAFSDANYMPKEGQSEAVRIGRMIGKPGI